MRIDNVIRNSLAPIIVSVIIAVQKRLLLYRRTASITYQLQLLTNQSFTQFGDDISGFAVETTKFKYFLTDYLNSELSYTFFNALQVIDTCLVMESSKFCNISRVITSENTIIPLTSLKY